MLDLVNVLVTCGDLTIPNVIPNLVHMVVLAVQIFIPIVLILLGMLDLGKAVMSNDEKEMKEKQNIFIRRLIYAVLIFLVISIVRLAVNVVTSATSGDSDSVASSSDISTCINYFVNGPSSSTHTEASTVGS